MEIIAFSNIMKYFFVIFIFTIDIYSLNGQNNIGSKELFLNGSNIFLYESKKCPFSEIIFEQNAERKGHTHINYHNNKTTSQWRKNNIKAHTLFFCSELQSSSCSKCHCIENGVIATDLEGNQVISNYAIVSLYENFKCAVLFPLDIGDATFINHPLNYAGKLKQKTAFSGKDCYIFEYQNIEFSQIEQKYVITTPLMEIGFCPEIGIVSFKLYKNNKKAKLIADFQLKSINNIPLKNE